MVPTIVLLLLSPLVQVVRDLFEFPSPVHTVPYINRRLPDDVLPEALDLLPRPLDLLELDVEDVEDALDVVALNSR